MRLIMVKSNRTSKTSYQRLLGLRHKGISLHHENNPFQYMGFTVGLNSLRKELKKKSIFFPIRRWNTGQLHLDFEASSIFNHHNGYSSADEVHHHFPNSIVKMHTLEKFPDENKTKGACYFY